MSAPIEFQIQGQTVRMPVVVRDASIGMATFLVPTKAAQRLIPGEDFEVVSTLPGRTPFALGAIDYKDNDLGDYNEVSMLFFVRPKGEPAGIPWVGALRDLVSGKLGTFIWKLPVNQSFTCEAGRGIWGFPKTVEEIDIRYPEGRCVCRLEMDGRHVFTLDVPSGGTRDNPEREIVSFTYIDGAPHRTRATQTGRGVRMGSGGATLQLGDHAIADDLRSLGLPKRALMTLWTEHMSGTFESPEKL